MIVNLYSGILGTYLTGGTWTDLDNSGLDISNPNSVDVSSGFTGEYRFEYCVEKNGCEDCTIVTVSICVKPRFTISGDTIYCEGDMLNLDVIVTGLLDYTVSWFRPSGFSSDSKQLNIKGLSQSDSGIYTVTVFSGCDPTCYKSEQVYIEIVPKQSAGIDRTITIGCITNPDSPDTIFEEESGG